jgi:Holliday junction resolvase RusA-like endonuclease
MINFSVDIRPMSVNKAWRGGRRFKSSFYTDFEKELSYLLPKKHIDGWVEIHYRFYLKNNFTNSDCSNFVKCLEDIMVKCDLITDDCMVKRFNVEKFWATRDRIEVEIISLKKENEQWNTATKRQKELLQIACW